MKTNISKVCKSSMNEFIKNINFDSFQLNLKYIIIEKHTNIKLTIAS